MVVVVGTEKASSGNGVFLAHMLVLAVLSLVLYLMYVVVLDAMMIHEKTKADVKQNQKLRERVEIVLKDLEEKK